MKKIMLMAMAVGAFTFASCSSDDDGGGNSCSQLAEDYADAIEAYANDPSDENCSALDDAAAAYGESDCEGASAAMGCS